MGLMDKVADALHGNKDNTKDTTYDSSTTSGNDSMRHPVSSNEGSHLASATGSNNNTASSTMPGAFDDSHNTPHTTGSSALPGSHGTSNTTGSGIPGSHGTSHTIGSGVPGSHETSHNTSSGIPGSHGTTNTTSGAMPGSTGTRGTHGQHDTLGRDRDGYGNHGTTGYDSSRTNDPSMMQKMDPRVDTSSNRQHGAYDSSRNDPSMMDKVNPSTNTHGTQNDPYSSNRQHGAYDSSRNDPSMMDKMNPSTNIHGTHIDPYSSNTTSGHNDPNKPSMMDKLNHKKDTSGYNTSSTGHHADYPSTDPRYGRSEGQHVNEPNVPRNTHGGVMNTSATNPNAIPTAGGHPVGSSNVNDPYASEIGMPDRSGHGHNTNTYDPSHSSSGGHNYGRDAAMAGGAYGAGSHGRHEPGMTSSDRHHEPGMTSSDRRHEPGMTSSDRHYDDRSMGQKMNPMDNSSSSSTRHGDYDSSRTNDPAYGEQKPSMMDKLNPKKDTSGRRSDGHDTASYEAGYRAAMEAMQRDGGVAGGRQGGI